MAEAKSTRVERFCELCGKSFKARADEIQRGWGRFCSRSCSATRQAAQKPRAPLLERFNKYVVLAESGCMIWVGARNPEGYGSIRIGGRAGRMTPAHRVAYELHNGPIPAGLLVCHHCDNPSCVNPEHLFVGTDAENTADSVAKGRRCVGERHRSTKLTEASVRAIRERHAAGKITRRDLAREYGVTYDVISKIVRRAIWKHV